MLADRMRVAAGGSKKPIVLLHCNESTFEDKGSAVLVWTQSDESPFISAGSDAKFGAGCLAGDVSKFIYLPSAIANSVLKFADKDFTIDFWIKPRVTGDVTLPILGQCSSSISAGQTSIMSYYHYANSSIWLRVSDGVTIYSVYTPYPYSYTVWKHVAFERYNNSLAVYVNGAKGTPIDVTDVSINNSSAYSFCLGSNGQEYNKATHVKYLDEIRIVLGKALYKGVNFTPETIEY